MGLGGCDGLLSGQMKERDGRNSVSEGQCGDCSRVTAGPIDLI